MSTLKEKIDLYETVKRANCPDCGNPWWFSEEHSYVCTTCAKTLGRSTGDQYIPKSVPLPSPREILEESSSFRPSLEKEKIVVEDEVWPCAYFGDDYDYDPRKHEGLIYVESKILSPLIGKRVRVTIEEIE